MILSRRGLLIGLGTAVAAPAIVRIESIMPVRALKLDLPTIEVFDGFTWQKIRELEFVGEPRGSHFVFTAVRATVVGSQPRITMPALGPLPIGLTKPIQMVSGDSLQVDLGPYTLE